MWGKSSEKESGQETSREGKEKPETAQPRELYLPTPEEADRAGEASQGGTDQETGDRNGGTTECHCDEAAHHLLHECRPSQLARTLP